MDNVKAKIQMRPQTLNKKFINTICFSFCNTHNRKPMFSTKKFHKSLLPTYSQTTSTILSKYLKRINHKDVEKSRKGAETRSLNFFGIFLHYQDVFKNERFGKRTRLHIKKR